jgi:hypothetical protein
MRRVLLALTAALVVWGCDQPDEVYRGLPDDYDPVVANGHGPVATHFTGTKGFADESQSTGGTSVPTREVCTDAEVSAKQAQMVNQPILPMRGAGGLDMTGGDDWAGLTIDEAQSPDLLCQALYYGDGVAAWGDYYELIAFFDTTTRKIDDILLTPGYKGTLTAGDFEFEINEAITKRGVPLSRGDGSNRDPRTEDNLRAMDRALITAFRPGLNAADIDCVEAGSCYIIMSGTLPVLVFMSVGVYVVLEPQQQHIVQMEISLKRPFRIGTGEIDVDGLDIRMKGTAAAGIPNCSVTHGTTWKHIRENCLGADPMAMAQITPAYGYENIVLELGGVLLYFTRPALAEDEILPIAPVMEDGDAVFTLSVNAAYEGDFSMPYSEVLENFKVLVDAAIRAEVPSLGADEPTGVEKLKTPADPNLPAEVKARYRDRLRPGGVYAAFCEPDGGDANAEYDACLKHSSGRPVMPLVRTLRSVVAGALGNRVTPKLTDSSFYVTQFERAVVEYFNGGPVGEDQINYTPSEGRPDTIYGTATLLDGATPYTVNVYYSGNDDRVHFLNFQKGASRMEKVLLRDAALPTPIDPRPTGTFTLTHLMSSPRMGLGAQGTIGLVREVPETRRALLSFKMSGTETLQVLAPYTPASSVSGYFLPLEGPHDQFVQADWFSLYGGTLGAGFFLAPVEPGADKKEVVAITGSNFFGDVAFCGFEVGIGDYADDLLARIAEAGYPCQMIVRESENRAFITSIADLDSQVKLYVTNNLIEQVLVWLR